MFIFITYIQIDFIPHREQRAFITNCIRWMLHIF